MADFWKNTLSPVEVTPGESGYFSASAVHLDPRLFSSGNVVRPEVRHWILSTLYSYWAMHFNSAQKWSQVWLAGSGISYQWAAARGNGDLDVLIGVDWPAFFEANPKYVGFSAEDVSDMMNQALHQDLWPYASTTVIGTEGAPHSADSGETGDVFEVTFYVNAHSTDIRDINPYAAYNVTTNEWTVRPPSQDQQAHPQAFYNAAHEQEQHIRSLVGRYNHYANELAVTPTASAAAVNTENILHALSTQAKNLFDDIHLGRRMAFSPGGSGYGDYYNFRWQYHKRAGTVQALDAIAHQRQASEEFKQTSLYGGPLKSTNLVLREAVFSQQDR